jgi:hypothetical protein
MSIIECVSVTKKQIKYLLCKKITLHHERYHNILQWDIEIHNEDFGYLLM